MVTVALILFGDTITAKRMVFCITITISFVVIMQKFPRKNITVIAGKKK